MFPFDRAWSIAEAAQLSCLLEASAPKAGNVHPGASFADMHFGHFAASATVAGQVFDPRRIGDYADAPVGSLILDAVSSTRRAVGVNTNLGTLLLLSPIAVAMLSTDEQARNSPGILPALKRTLSQLNERDCELVYDAIRLAQPGGLGEQPKHDLADAPPRDLLAAMQVVAEFDAVARQYTNNFADIWHRLLPWLDESLAQTQDPLQAIVALQIRWLAHEPDGLIVRKKGLEAALRVRDQAREVLDSCNWDRPLPEQKSFSDLDRFLRSDGNRLNPGTTADLIAATIFVALTRNLA